MPQIDLFVINLKRSRERRDRMEDRLGSLGLKHTFIEAVDGNELSDQDILEIQAKASSLQKKWPNRGPVLRGEIGCALSHLKVYEKVVNENLDYACILEDDVCIDFPRVLRYILEKENLVNLNRRCAFDFIYLLLPLGCKETKEVLFSNIANPVDIYARWGRIETDKRGIYICKPCFAPYWGSGGYIASKRACEIFLSEGRRPITLADLVTAKAELWGIKQYLINPAPLKYDCESTSTIDPLQQCLGQTEPKPFTPMRIFYLKLRWLLRKSGIISYKSLVKLRLYDS